MTSAGKKQHQKRISAPSIWPIHRKGSMWVPKIKPGPHSKNNGMPLLVLLRDVLKIGQNKTEVTRILTKRQVLIDGRVVTNNRFPVGHMDVVQLPKSEKSYRIQLHGSNKLVPFEIPESSASEKVCKVTGKRNIRGGKTQISLHDGRNILLDNDDKLVSQIKGMCSVKISVPSQEILDVYPFEEDARALVTEGRHRGRIGKIVEITKRYGPKASEVVFLDENAKGDEADFRTALDYVFIIGPDLKLEL